MPRKDDHLDLCLSAEVEPHGIGTLFSEVHLLHDPLPELAVDEVNLSGRLFDKPLTAPLLITGMTGGTERAGAFNRALAEAAEREGVAFAVGSQRPMLDDPALAGTFRVRDVAPTIPLLGNLGLWQARALGADGVRRLYEAIGADGIAIHLNAAQELSQPEGDRDFRNGFTTLSALARALGDRLVVKETGCGMGPATVRRLVNAGVKTIDVSGAGGTSWPLVEGLRARGGAGTRLAGWGIPTAAALAAAAPWSLRVRLIGSGGIRNGVDAAKALALGAELVGFALPALKACSEGGADGVQRLLAGIKAELAAAMALTASRDLTQLRRAPRVLGRTLVDWMAGFERLV